MKVTKILGIAPYEGMRTLMLELAETMDHILLDAYVGDMEAGVDIVNRHMNEGYDVILSRGGTAELIRSRTSLPVVDIELSLYDLLRAMHLAEISNSKCALVGFPAITRNATYLCDVLDYRIELNTIHDEKEARTVLKRLAADGCQMVLCDMITNSLAHEFGLPAMLIVSGRESIENAMKQATAISRCFTPMRQKAELLEAVLSSGRENQLVMDEDGDVLFQSQTEFPEGLIKRCAEWIAAVPQGESRRFTCSLSGKQYSVIGTTLNVGLQSYVSFRFRMASARLSLDKYGIRFFNREEVTDHFFNSFYGITQPVAVQRYEAYAKKGSPILIIGERGTGKDQMAQLLYSNGKYRNNLICVIDCALLQDRGWDYLMENEASPLAGEGYAVHFINVSSLPPDRYLQLFSLLRDTRYDLRNQLLFTASLTAEKKLPEWARQVSGWFDCAMISLPLLQEHAEDIPHLATLYISMLNARNGKEIAMIEPEAMQMLMTYSWPANFDQFKRVLQGMVMETEGVSVRTELVSRLLQKEKLLYPEMPGESFGSAVRGKTMAEIEIMAARQALADAEGNRTAAAQLLGISRTSLWRLLQSQE